VTRSPTRSTLFPYTTLFRSEFEFDAARAIELVEHVGVGLAGEGTDDLAHAPGLEQRGQAGVAIARIVVDDDEVFGAMGDKAIDELGRLARAAEAADHDGGPVMDAGKRLFD